MPAERAGADTQTTPKRPITRTQSTLELKVVFRGRLYLDPQGYLARIEPKLLRCITLHCGVVDLFGDADLPTAYAYDETEALSDSFTYNEIGSTSNSLDRTAACV